MLILEVGAAAKPHDALLLNGLDRDLIQSPMMFRVEWSSPEELASGLEEDRYDLVRMDSSVWAEYSGTYDVLRTGGVFSRSDGPFLIGRPGIDPDRIEGRSMTHNGHNTIYQRAISLLLGTCPNINIFHESDLLQAVARGEVDLALIGRRPVEEIRATGAEILMDIGLKWAEETQTPLPLEVFAVRRDLGPDMSKSIDNALKESLGLALSGPEEAVEQARDRIPGLAPEDFQRSPTKVTDELFMDFGAVGLRALELLHMGLNRTNMIESPQLPIAAY